MRRISAQMDARNAASARVAERLGMTREALHRQDYWSKGEWTDSLVHAALASDRRRDVGDAIVVSAVTLRDAEGRVLTVRKRGTQAFMQPGGKPEAGEERATCALREVEEELGLTLDPAQLELIAVRRTAAANEAGRPLIATVFRHPHLSGGVDAAHRPISRDRGGPLAGTEPGVARGHRAAAALGGCRRDLVMSGEYRRRGMSGKVEGWPRANRRP